MCTTDTRTHTHADIVLIPHTRPTKPPTKRRLSIQIGGALDSVSRILWRLLSISGPITHRHTAALLFCVCRRQFYCCNFLSGVVIVLHISPFLSHAICEPPSYGWPQAMTSVREYTWHSCAAIGLGLPVYHPIPRVIRLLFERTGSDPKKTSAHIRNTNRSRSTIFMFYNQYYWPHVKYVPLNVWFVVVDLLRWSGAFCCCCCCQTFISRSALLHGSILKGIKFPLRHHNSIYFPDAFAQHITCTRSQTIIYIINWEHATLTFEINQRSANAVTATAATTAHL